MSKRYSIQILRHSCEKEQLKTFINLDGNQLGIEFSDDLSEFRYFIYRDKKRNVVCETDWYKTDSTLPELEKPLHDMILTWYKEHDHGLKKNDLPMYTRLELKIPVTHLYYHVNAGTLPKLLEKEIIYF